MRNRHLTVTDVAASVMSTSVDLMELEVHDQDVAFEDIEALARYFKKPWSYLLSDDSEQFRPLGEDHRTLANQRRAPSVNLLDEYEAASLMLDAATELFHEEPYVVPSVRIALDVTPDIAGAAIRDLLGVSIGDQLSAGGDFAALRLWIRALHRQRVYVSQRGLRDPTIRAFSKVENDHAIIVVDTGDTAYARVFSALHEYCHVVLRNAGVCDLDDELAVEQYCNHVAAATLMPQALLADRMLDHQFGQSDDADDELLKWASRHYNVSQAALLIRLRELGTISPRQYEALEARRSHRRGGARHSGGTYYSPAINRVGRRFAHNTFEALDGRLIDRQDAAVLLGVGEHLVPRYRIELENGDADGR